MIVFYKLQKFILLVINSSLPLFAFDFLPNILRTEKLPYIFYF